MSATDQCGVHGCVLPCAICHPALARMNQPVPVEKSYDAFTDSVKTVIGLNLKKSELLVLLYVITRTIDRGIDRTVLSYAEIGRFVNMRGCEVSRAAKTLIAKGYLTVDFTQARGINGSYTLIMGATL